MKIIYALAGEGRGHGSLAKAILPALEKAGHKVKIVTYGQSIDQLKDYDVLKIRGIKFYYAASGKLSLSKTIIKNLGVLKYFIFNWNKLKNEIKNFSPDIVLVNFEPFIPLIAKSMRIPTISFDNQHSLLHIAHDVPKGMKYSSLLSKTAIKFVAPWAKYYILIAFGNEAMIKDKVYAVPPVIQRNILKLHPKKTNKVLVYMKKPNPRLFEILKSTKENYVIYGCNSEKKDKNLTYRVFNKHMPEELAESKAVIATAGMSLVSEALYLKKPFFAVPIKNEFEQLLNCIFLKKSNFGDYAEEPTAKQIEQFFKNLGKYEKSLKKYNFNPLVAEKKLLELIDKVRIETKTL